MNFDKRIMIVVLLLSLMGTLPAFAQTVDLTINNQQVSGGYLYFDVVLNRTSAWAADFLGDCSFYFSYNNSALSNPSVTSQHADLTLGNGYSITSGTNAPYVYVTITYGFSETPMAISQNIDYTLFTLRMDIDDSGANSNLNWNTTASAVLDVADQSTTESYYGGSDVTLPVELSSLTANQNGNVVDICWTTESEVENLGFIVQRSIDDQETWTQVASYNTHAELMGQGTSSKQTIYNFTDSDVQSGTVSYRLSEVSTSGQVNILGTVDVSLSKIPEKTELDMAYPNPFNPVTTISYHMAKDGPVEISVYNLLGSKVKTLIDMKMAAGSYQTIWQGKDDSGQQAASGMYLVVMKAGQKRLTQKVLLIK